MADDQDKRAIAKDDPKAATDDSSSSDSDDGQQPGLPRWRPRLQLHHLEAPTPCASPELTAGGASASAKSAPSTSSKLSASSSPVKRAAGAVAGAVSTALRKAVTSQCCVNTGQVTSPEDVSPGSAPSPEELLQKSPDKSCLRVRTPSPEPVSPKHKVTFAGVSEASVDDDDDGSSTSEREPYQQRHPRDGAPSSSQPAQEMPWATVVPQVVIQTPSPAQSEEGSESSLKPEAEKKRPFLETDL
ncbi:hypothetical protein MRX96_033508 [Rhipicephalus microplus]